MDTTRLDKLMKRRDQLTAQINDAKARQRSHDAKQRRRDDTRRKVITGALALEHAEKNPTSVFARVLYWLLEKYVPDHSRHLFPFEEMREAQKLRPTLLGLGQMFKTKS